MNTASMYVMRESIRQLIRLTLFSSVLVFCSVNIFASDTEVTGFDSGDEKDEEALDIEEQGANLGDDPKRKLVKLYERALSLHGMEKINRVERVDAFNIWLENDFWTEEKIEEAIALLEYLMAPKGAKPTQYQDRIERLIRDFEAKKSALGIAGFAGIGEGLVACGSGMACVIGGTIGTAVSCAGMPGCPDGQEHVEEFCYFHNGTLAGHEQMIKNDTDCSIGASISFGIPLLILAVATLVAVPVIVVCLCTAWKKHVDWKASSVRLRDETGIGLLPEIIMASPRMDK